MIQSGTPAFRAGDVLQITFPAFTPRTTFHSDQELTVEIVAGDNAGFTDTVQYEADTVREGLVVLSWQEHIGSTIVHVLDIQVGQTYSLITPAKGGFIRLIGRIDRSTAS
jgi:molybdenum cofactor biosynthesis MoaF-like protein